MLWLFMREFDFNVEANGRIVKISLANSQIKKKKREKSKLLSLVPLSKRRKNTFFTNFTKQVFCTSKLIKHKHTTNDDDNTIDKNVLHKQNSNVIIKQQIKN